ncbi:Kinesin-like protein KIF27 [Amazona aestiva]|uniref:Kinesin-like protein KIF27 n=1 Tax=Amazona aestiva TaxID=12930 RepID=A0A0Q3TIU9_AMAAE|nr:Kinesin-like protein KIF27 [Amazona aestiva]
MESGMEEIPVKVAVRIRPLLSKEVLHNHQVCVRLVPNTQQIIIGKDRVFTFDFVFGKNSTQEEVYTVCIKPLLVSLTEGYNATVFAYGQTGSGKTYTIGGGHIASVAEDEEGIIPRAIQELFQRISENRNIDFHVKVSYIEVYKEELRDLLDLENSVKELHIREDDKGNTVIVGAKELQVECADEVMSLLENGNAARHTGTTQINEHSSRSHAIFTISICQKWSAESQKSNAAAQNASWKSADMTASKFHFVDLAGSGRVTKTGNTGEHFKESIQINSDLLALENVISALGDPKRKSVHVPYRDAKITRILKDSLGGNARTVMITCISPSSSDLDESLNSLKYANRAKNIRNKPVANYNPDQDRVDEMEFEISLLQEVLQNQQVNNKCSHDLNQEKNQISSLEEQLARLQVQYFNYRTCVDEAFLFLVDLNDNVSLKRSQRNRLQSWITMVQEVRKEDLMMQEADTGTETSRMSHHTTILQLKQELKKCQVYTTPAAFSLTQVMAKFRARSEMMLSHMEDQDKVLHCHLSDQSDEEDENTGSKNKTSFKHSINRTWTRKQASLCFLPDLSDMKCQVDKSCLSNKSALHSDTITGEEIDSLQKRHVFNMQKLKNSELRFTEAKQKIRELALNIKMKKELIKELARTGKDAQFVSRQCSLKITKLEQESEQAKLELAETQKQLQELQSNKELRDIPEKTKLQKEFQKKMDAAKLKVQALQKKQQDTKKLASLSNQSERQAAELEQNVAQMKRQQTQLQKRLCEESEKKQQLEAEILRDQQQIKELQLKMEQQQKILQLKDKEITAFKKKKNDSVETSQKLQIVGLRESERKLQLQIEEQEMKFIDQENLISELESALDHVKLQCDRQLTLQHKEHEKNLQLILHHFKDQDSEGISETLKAYEVKVQQLEKELFFYKKTSRELKKLKGLTGESSHQLWAATECNTVDDKASGQDEAEVASKEFKLTLNPETNSQPGKIKASDRTSILRAQQNLHNLGEDVAEFGCNKECLSSTSDDKTETGEAQPSKSYPHPSSVTQRKEAMTQFQGVTPVKLSRRELRHIPPSKLLLRRSSLGVGVSFIIADSIEMDKKSSVSE